MKISWQIAQRVLYHDAGVKSDQSYTEILDIDRCSEWISVNSIPEQFYGRTGHSASEIDHEIYIFGGSNYSVYKI